jgi:hypothetical protein
MVCFRQLGHLLSCFFTNSRAEEEADGSFLQSRTLIAHVAATIAFTTEGEREDVGSFDNDILAPQLSMLLIMSGDKGVNIREEMKAGIANTAG